MKIGNLITFNDVPDSNGDVYKKQCFGKSLENAKQDFEIDHVANIPHSVGMTFIKHD